MPSSFQAQSYPSFSRLLSEFSSVVNLCVVDHRRSTAQNNTPMRVLRKKNMSFFIRYLECGKGAFAAAVRCTKSGSGRGKNPCATTTHSSSIRPPSYRRRRRIADPRRTSKTSRNSSRRRGADHRNAAESWWHDRFFNRLNFAWNRSACTRQSIFFLPLDTSHGSLSLF